MAGTGYYYPFTAANAAANPGPGGNAQAQAGWHAAGGIGGGGGANAAPNVGNVGGGVHPNAGHFGQNGGGFGGPNAGYGVHQPPNVMGGVQGQWGQPGGVYVGGGHPTMAGGGQAANGGTPGMPQPPWYWGGTVPTAPGGVPTGGVGGNMPNGMQGAGGQAFSGGGNPAGFGTHGATNFGGAAFGPVPANWMNFQGVGLGHQPMGAYAAAGGAQGGPAGMPAAPGYQHQGGGYPAAPNNPNGGGMGGPMGAPPHQGGHPGVPQPPINFPPMAGMAAGQNFGGPAGTIVPTIPPPMQGCGNLGNQCYRLGPWDGESVTKEVMDEMVAMSAPTFNRVEWLRKVSTTARPFVMITMSPHSLQVLPMYGLQQYHTMGGPASVLEERWFAFLGSGDGNVRDSLHMLPQSTLDTIGTTATTWAATEAALDQWFGNQGVPPSQLLPPAVANGPNEDHVGVELTMHVPLSMVYIFGDCPHPYTALLRLRMIEQSLTAAMRHRLIPLHWWLRVACHMVGPATPISRLALRFDKPMSYDGGVLAWAQSKHDLLVPSGPTIVQQSAPPQEESGLVQEMRGMREDMRNSRKAEFQGDKGSRRMKDRELSTYKSYCGVSQQAETAELPEFFHRWESTAQNEPAMNTMFFEILKDSALECGYKNFVQYHPPTWVKDMRSLQFGHTFGKSYVRAHRGLSILAIAGMEMSEEEAGIVEENYERWSRTTNRTGDDFDGISGLSGVSPTSLEELRRVIECYIIYLNAFIGLAGSHQKQVKRLRDILVEDFDRSTMLQQEYIDNIIWCIFVDSRDFFTQRSGRAASGLTMFVNMFSATLMPAVLNVPYAQLSGSQGPTKC